MIRIVEVVVLVVWMKLIEGVINVIGGWPIIPEEV
jgi:hypothetical protein